MNITGQTAVENDAGAGLERPQTDTAAGPLFDDLDDLLAETVTPAVTVMLTTRFGTVSQPRDLPPRQDRRRFRIALIGDFTGRAVRGVLQVGDGLADRAGRVLDPDTIDQIIAGFATTLVLPLGQDGAGMAVTLSALDDLHPDALFDAVPLFAELRALRRQLGQSGTAAGAARLLGEWAAAHDQPLAPTRRHASGTAMRADLRLSEFQTLIGGTVAAPAASAVDLLLARIVGPHIRRAPDPGLPAMIAAVDAALSAAMRLVLHHPDFQALEAQWRSLDLIARSIEADDTLEVVLYDVSAEELAADLTTGDDLTECGLLRLLADQPLDPKTGRGPFSAIVGLYRFEETPPHADLLGRIAQVAASLDAPFIASISPVFLATGMADRHPLVAAAWDSLRAHPQAGYLGLVTPRFLLRHPYGARTEPIDAFKFEEFTLSEGLSGMVWANPAVLATILLARSFRQNGRAMKLGSIMSLGDMPYHVVTDAQGDQTALPCTETLISLDGHRIAVQRGYMPVMAVKGRNEVRLGSFNALSGTALMGAWSDLPRPAPDIAAPDPATPDPATPDPADAPAEAALADLDDLLAGFDDPGPVPAQSGEDDMDAALMELLNDL